jgi:hypothetical protein
MDRLPKGLLHWRPELHGWRQKETRKDQGIRWSRRSGAGGKLHAWVGRDPGEAAADRTRYVRTIDVFSCS